MFEDRFFLRTQSFPLCALWLHAAFFFMMLLTVARFALSLSLERAIQVTVATPYYICFSRVLVPIDEKGDGKTVHELFQIV